MLTLFRDPNDFCLLSAIFIVLGQYDKKLRYLYSMGVVYLCREQYKNKVKTYVGDTN